MATYNVMDAPFSAAGDAKRLLDGVTAATSDLVTSASANFQPGDVGKVIWVNDPVLAVPTLAQTTIIARNSATEVQVADAATVNGSGLCLVYGTDDTVAFQDAFDACVTNFNGSVPGVIEVPGNGYIISERWYRNNGTALQVAGPSVIGDGKKQTQLYLAPTFTVPGDGTPVVMEMVGSSAEWRGLLVDGCYSVFATASGQKLIWIAETQSPRISNFDVRNVGVGAGSFMLGFEGCRQSLVSGVTVQNLGIVGSGGGIEIDDCAGLFEQCFTSNTLANLVVQNCVARSPITTPLIWTGGGIDEGGTPACSLVNASIVFDTIVNFCGIDPPSVAFSVDGNSSLYIYNSNVGRFLGYVGQARAVNIAAGGLVVSGGTTWRGNAPPGTPTQFMINAGTFVDVGGNDYRRYSDDTTYTVATPADCFSGNQPVVNGSYSPYNQPLTR